VPRGSRRVRSQREAFRAGKNCPELAGVRGDFRASLIAWWQIHARHASWGGEDGPPRGTTAHLSRDSVRRKAMTGRPGPDGKPRPMSTSVYKRCRRWWAERGYVGTVREGTTPELERCRRGVLYELAPLDGNQTPVYVLCVPRTACRAAARRPDSQPAGIVETRNGPPSNSRREIEIPARARPTAKPGSSSQHRDHARAWPLRGVSDGWWAHLTGPFTAAGWSAAHLTWAIDHHPDGQQNRERLANVRHPVGWLRYRLARWLGPDGAPLPSRRQQLAAAADAHRAYLAERRRSDPVGAARADQLRAAYAAAGRGAVAEDQAPAAELLTRLRARLGQPAPSGHWQDPAELARQQVAEARARRAEQETIT